MRLMSALIVLLVLLSLALPAFAGQQCAKRDEVVAALAQQYGEAPQMQGLSADGRMMEIWANPRTGSWTATMTTPDGITCLPAAGEEFHAVKPGTPA